jgi:uncharacterized BrkB/YihY/UPF0761 family membrane protein
METEAHVYALAVAASVLLSFYPFLIVMLSFCRNVLHWQAALDAVSLALDDYFPGDLGNFIWRNLPTRGHVQWVSMLLLLFTANGIFEPLEIGLNHVWGIRTNRSFFRNQLISLGLIFACGSLAMLSVLAAGLHTKSFATVQESVGGSFLFLKLVAMPLAAVSLVMIYRFLPNGRPPMKRVIPAAIVIGMLLEVFKYTNALVWPWFYLKLDREYGVFKNSVSLIFIGFLGSMLVLAGAEWSARGHRMDQSKEKLIE